MTVRDSWWSRASLSVYGFWVWATRPGYRELTAAEVTVIDRDKEILGLRTEVDILNAKLSVANIQIASLTEVIVRDRKRVEAETALYCRRCALGNTENGNAT